MNAAKGYPSEQESNREWTNLAREISRDKYVPINETTEPRQEKGSLVILGSGIQSIGFTLNAVEEIKSSDYLFYCINDPVTQVWLREIKPDAFDLSVLYEDTKDRYQTYMQMSEAILFYVRKGKKVVAIFYGHPGVFAISTHRAIKIAIREGHQAIMFAGISALDCLCADLGVDPGYPGMQTFEATDMLLRLREPDIYSHVVLWQVGFVGEMGYRRSGFVNDKFAIFVHYLEKFYGPDFEITHYIAPMYPTIAPIIEIYKISQLINQEVRSRINDTSTLYLPPKEARQTDKKMAVALGLIDEADQPKKAPHLMIIDRYDKREMDAISQFKDFVVPSNYRYQHKTRAAEFIVRLCLDAEFRQLYKMNPDLATSEEFFDGLTEQQRTLLASRIEGAVQMAIRTPVEGFRPNE